MKYNLISDYISERNTDSYGKPCNLSQLRVFYSQKKLALLLGAGVSFPYNKKTSWPSLVRKLFKYKFAAKYAYCTNAKFDFSLLSPDDSSASKTSLLDIAEYASPSISATIDSDYEIFERKSRFSALMVQRILESVNEGMDGKGVTVLTALAQLCIDKHNQKVNIGNVITYNYDDYFEAGLLEEVKDCPTVDVAMINEDNTLKPFYYRETSGDCISVYHVHGFIPISIDAAFLSKVNSKKMPSASKKIILGDGSYNSLEDDDRLWSNSIQTQVNTQMPIFCVGFSCTDTNFRRLFAAIRRSPTSFPIYSLQAAEEFAEELPALLGIAKADVTDPMVTCYMEIVEEYYMVQYGIRIIWVERFADMPRIISSISGYK